MITTTWYSRDTVRPSRPLVSCTVLVVPGGVLLVLLVVATTSSSYLVVVATTSTLVREYGSS